VSGILLNAQFSKSMQRNLNIKVQKNEKNNRKTNYKRENEKEEENEDRKEIYT
jgi:hypothetical protein